MRGGESHWATRFSKDKPKRRPTFSIFRRAKILAKSLILVILLAIFVSLFVIKPETESHNIALASDSEINLMKLQELLFPEEYDHEESDYNGLSQIIANRNQTSFLNLSAGCTSETKWLFPKKGEPKPDEEFGLGGNSNYDWVSFPPVVGDYADKDWEGVRINVRLSSDQPIKESEQMSFSDALRLLYQGNYVIWYHPRMLDEYPFELQALDDAVFNLAVSNRGFELGNVYLAELPAFYGLASMERNIYYTKLNYTQSCIKFNQNILNNFYDFQN